MFVGNWSYKAVFNMKAVEDILPVARSCNVIEFLFCDKGRHLLSIRTSG